MFYTSGTLLLYKIVYLCIERSKTMTLKDLHKSISELESTPLMPMLFVGHGSPMNAVEDNT